jgi:hypothetical protein
MRSCVLLTLALISCGPALAAQSAPPFQIYGGYTRLSNSFNGIPESQNALNGWDAGVALPAWHGLRAKIDVSRYSGTNLGAQQHALSIMGGGQYERTFHRERFFVEALFGYLGMNHDWGPNAQAGESASFTTLLGGGLDTPLNKHFDLLRESRSCSSRQFGPLPSTGFAAEFRQHFDRPGLGPPPRTVFVHRGKRA